MTPTLLFLAACAAPETNPGPVDEFEATLAELEAKATEHSDAVVGMTDPGAIADEEAAFWDLCQGLWDDAGTCWERMNSCGMGGMMGGAEDDWDTWMADMSDAMSNHHDMMGDCAQAVQCHEMETTWHDTMSAKFDQMRGMKADWPDDCHW